MVIKTIKDTRIIRKVEEEMITDNKENPGLKAVADQIKRRISCLKTLSLIGSVQSVITSIGRNE